MILIDERVLKAARAEKRCAICGKRKLVQAMHIMSKGAGRVDIPGNVLPGCVDDHRREHDGNITKDALLMIAGRREGVDPEVIRDTVNLFRRIPKGYDVPISIIAMCEDAAVIKYARRCWEAHTKGRRIKR